MTTESRTVLVVDDDLMMGELMAAIIDSADYHTVLASNGPQALQLAETTSPSIVFCDFTMPGMNGDEVLRSLRANPRTNHIPLVLMTGHASSDMERFGADAFLQKPFCLEEVVPLLTSVVKNHADAALAVLPT
jgi:CheY-like chemotaxis protein